MNVTIIGCGWLGTQAGEHLSQKGNKVYGSYRSLSQKEAISRTNIVGFELDLDDKSQISISISENTDILILALPPIRKKELDYFGTLLCNCINQFPGTTKVLYTSSIGIYPSKEYRFTEGYSFQENERNFHFNTESKLKNLLGDRLTILRLGGLIGPGRHPVKSLQGKSISNDGMAPINLVHSTDICEAIEVILSRKAYNKCYNLVFPSTISKKVYYSFIIKKYDLTAIEFGAEQSINRSIDGSFISNDLGIIYSIDPQNYSEVLG